MPSQTVFEFQPRAIQSADLPSNSFCVLGTVVSICESPAYLRMHGDADDSHPDGLGCARGLRSVFALEAVTALLVYGVWQLWHIIR